MNRWQFYMALAAVLWLTGSVYRSGAGVNPANDRPTTGERALVIEDLNEDKSDASLISKNWLIAIGINQFDDPSVPPLQYCVRDARAISEVFSGSGKLVDGRRSILLTSDATDPTLQPTRDNIFRVVQDAARDAQPDETIILHISAHGFLDDQGRSYIFPTDGRVDNLAQTAVSVKTLNEMLETSKAQRKVVFVDACRNPIQAGVRALGGATDAGTFNESFRGGKGQVTLTSCAAGQVSNESDRIQHGVFTYYLIKGLQGEAGVDVDGFVTLGRLHEYVGRMVPQWSRDNNRPLQEAFFDGSYGSPIPLSRPDLPSTPEREPVENGWGDLPDIVLEGSPVIQGPDRPTGPAVVSVPEPVGPPMKNVPLRPGLQVDFVRIASPEGGSGFWIGRTEVTQAQYAAVIPGPHPSTINHPDLPVDRVSWEQATRFCQELSKRTGLNVQLPTEAQWVQACGTGGFAAGIPLSESAWFGDNAAKQMRPPAQKQPNECGVYDMLGNVWEWCRDGYDSPVTLRVVRGGSYLTPAFLTQPHIRQGRRPGDPHMGVGFRIVIED